MEINREEFTNDRGHFFFIEVLIPDRHESMCIGTTEMQEAYNAAMDEESSDIDTWIEIDNEMYAYLPKEELSACQTAKDVLKCMEKYGIDIPDEFKEGI